MSRSYRKTPICGATTARSESLWKKSWHRRYRKMQKRSTERVLRIEASNIWDGPKDGKHWFGKRIGWKHFNR